MFRTLIWLYRGEIHRRFKLENQIRIALWVVMLVGMALNSSWIGNVFKLLRDSEDLAAFKTTYLNGGMPISALAKLGYFSIFFSLWMLASVVNWQFKYTYERICNDLLLSRLEFAQLTNNEIRHRCEWILAINYRAQNKDAPRIKQRMKRLGLLEVVPNY